MLVRDAMIKNPVTCTVKTTLREAVGLMRKNHIGGLPVMDGAQLVGILTESDLIPIREYINWEKTRRALQNIGDRQVKEVMTRKVVTATEEMGGEEAAALMLKGGIVRLPVLRGKTLVGILARADLINAIGSSYPD